MATRKPKPLVLVALVGVAGAAAIAGALSQGGGDTDPPQTSGYRTSGEEFASRGAAVTNKAAPDASRYALLTGTPGAPAIAETGSAEVPSAAASAAGPSPARGVYECYGQNAMVTPMAFSILDASNYMDSFGKRGSFAYDDGSGVLTLDPGGEPARYQRTSERSFRVIDPDTGELGGFTCPLNEAKDPERPPW